MFQPLSPKLTDQERESLLKPLLEKNWRLDAEKDAISKEFLFKDFNQVIFYLKALIHIDFKNREEGYVTKLLVSLSYNKKVIYTWFVSAFF